MNFTYSDRRIEIKKKFELNPFSCTYSWVINWINKEISNLPSGSNVLEIGTFVGGTTRLFALANPSVFIHSIDLNNFNDDNHMLIDMRSEMNLPNLVATDLLEIQKMHTEDLSNVKLYTGYGRSLDLNNIALSFIDANHDTSEVLQDLEYVWERTIPNGYIYGDDANEPAVFNAFSMFAKEKDVELTIYSKCARIQKTEKISPNLRFYAPKNHPVNKDILLVNYEDR